ncbi:preprotein translocase subunit SecG [bacterium]|nr:preprotein translocase subunit SecG [candidate division CSSED10-310 bacterium]
MYVLISLIHVLLCIALILIVLLQTGKGSDLASAFGGGGTQAMFGGRGPSSFLNKSTTVFAVLFMVTSITLAYMSSGKTSSVISGMDEPAATETLPGQTEEQPVDTGPEPVEGSGPQNDTGDFLPQDDRGGDESGAEPGSAGE